MALGEVLVKPVQSGDSKPADYYQRLITSTAVLLPFEEKAALVYARLRADRSLRPPDAIQLACAASAGVDLFITNDLHLHSKQIPGIQFIAPLHRIPILAKIGSSPRYEGQHEPLSRSPSSDTL